MNTAHIGEKMVQLKSLRSETPYGRCANCEAALNENYECVNGCTEDPLYALMDDSQTLAIETGLCPICDSELSKGVCDNNPDHWPPEDIDESYYKHFEEE